METPTEETLKKIIGFCSSQFLWLRWVLSLWQEEAAMTLMFLTQKFLIFAESDWRPPSFW